MDSQYLTKCQFFKDMLKDVPAAIDLKKNNIAKIILNIVPGIRLL